MAENTLPNLQKQILLQLAQKGPMTKHEIAKTLGKVYKNVDYAIKSLTKKNLITHVGLKEYRNRKFEKFWLAPKGLLEAFRVGAAASDLKKHMYHLGTPYIITSEDKEAAELLFEFLEAIGRNKVKALYPAIDFTGPIPKLTGIPLNFASGHEAKKLLRILTKHPTYKMQARKTLQELIEELDKS